LKRTHVYVLDRVEHLLIITHVVCTRIINNVESQLE